MYNPNSLMMSMMRVLADMPFFVSSSISTTHVTDTSSFVNSGTQVSQSRVALSGTWVGTRRDKSEGRRGRGYSSLHHHEKMVRIFGIA